MPSSRSQFALSPLEEERFGVRTTRVPELTSAVIPELLDFCREERVRMVVARCSTADLAAAQDLEQAGGRLMDTLVYYVHEFARRPAPDAARSVRPVRPAEVDEVCAIAARSFEGYQGHYHADRRLERAACDGVYPDWVRRSVLDRSVADEVLVGELDGRVSSFATLRRNSPEEGEGVLFGVAPWAQGRGLYAELIRAGLAWCRSAGLARMVVSTQITNLAVQKVWVRQGFEPQRSYYTFHLWVA
jgi:predicted acetyltransferase